MIRQLEALADGLNDIGKSLLAARCNRMAKECFEMSERIARELIEPNAMYYVGVVKSTGDAGFVIDNPLATPGEGVGQIIESPVACRTFGPLPAIGQKVRVRGLRTDQIISAAEWTPES